jgi:hypothetical protein
VSRLACCPRIFGAQADLPIAICDSPTSMPTRLRT